MTRAARAVLLPLAVLAACTERPSAEAYLDVVPQLVEFVEADARREQPGQPATGPLIVDLPSFAYGARSVTGSAVDTTRVRDAIGKPFLSIPFAQADSALLCDQGSGVGGCWVRQYGVYLKLNEARSTADRMSVLVMSTSTNRSAFPTGICDRIWRLAFERRGEEWALTERDLRRDTCEGAEEVQTIPIAPGG